jgi:hypothetical protein
MNPRKGLKRWSYATYMVEGHGRIILIRRNGRRHYLVGDAKRPLLPGFFAIKCRRLTDAVEFARKLCA